MPNIKRTLKSVIDTEKEKKWFISKKMRGKLADSKNSRTFASLLKRSTLEREFWRDGRVVDRGGLENRCTERYRGFESLSLRNKR